MYGIYILSCLVAFVIHSSHGELPDSIKYSCIASNDSAGELNQIVIARGLLQNVSNIYAYKVNNIWDQCITNNNDTHFIILGCWNYDVIVAPINISHMIIGGKESKLYQLKCVGPDKTHTNVTVDISESIKYAGSANVYGMDTVNAYGFDMIILDQHNQAKDTFLIGDPMTMQIVPTAAHKDIQWRVLSCTAYSAPVEIEFVKNANVVSDSRIAKVKQNVSGDLYEIQLYAFHGVHNNEVTYTCTIEICLETAHDSKCMGTTTKPTTPAPNVQGTTGKSTTPAPNVQGTTGKSTTPAPNVQGTTGKSTTPAPNVQTQIPIGRRRRRSADDYPTIHTAKVKIHVYDRTEDMPASGAFQSSLSMTMICGVSLLMWIYK